MRLAGLEETIALYCETLLLRPELTGFHPHNKPVLARQLSEKLNLYGMLIKAAGTLYDIETDTIEQNISVVRGVGEDSNAVIHGLLYKSDASGLAFRSRGRDVPATLDAMRNLTKRSEDAAMELTALFSAFYDNLVRKKSTLPNVEKAMQEGLQKWLDLHTSSYALREKTLKVRELEAAWLVAYRQVEESQTRLAMAKKNLGKTRARRKREDSEQATTPSVQ